MQSMEYARTRTPRLAMAAFVALAALVGAGCDRRDSTTPTPAAPTTPMPTPPTATPPSTSTAPGSGAPAVGGAASAASAPMR